MNCILCGVHHNGLFIWVTCGRWNKYVHTFQRHLFKTSNHHISFTLDNILHLTKHEIIQQIRSRCLFEDFMDYSKEKHLHVLKTVSRSKTCVIKTLARFCSLTWADLPGTHSRKPLLQEWELHVPWPKCNGYTSCSCPSAGVLFCLSVSAGWW